VSVRRAPRLLRSVGASAVREDGGMASVAILVNGLPGSGKTTLSATLAGVLGCPLLARDPITEALVDLAGPMIAPEALGGIAMDTVWAMAGEVEAGVVVDASWHRERDLEFARAGVERAGSPRTVEVWCDVDPEVALQRVVDRLAAGGRHPAHGTVESARAAWPTRVAGAEPLGLWPVIRVDTSAPVDMDDLVMQISARFV
jgi:predicted kinase